MTALEHITDAQHLEMLAMGDLLNALQGFRQREYLLLAVANLRGMQAELRAAIAELDGAS